MRDLPPTSASDAWLLERLCELLELRVDPLDLHQAVRTAPSLAAAASRLGLELTPADPGTAGVWVRQQPPAVLHSRDGASAVLETPEAEPTAVPLAGSSGPWLAATVAAPLQALAEGPSPWARLVALARLEREDLGAIVIYAAFVGLLSLATPVAVQALVGSVAFGTLLQPIVVLSVLLLAALGFQAVLRALQARLVEAVEARAFVRVALDFAWRLPRVRREAVGEHGFGPSTVNLFFEVVSLQKTAHVLLTDGVATVLSVGIGLLVLAFYHPYLLAFTLALVVLMLAVVALPWKAGLASSLAESSAKYEVAEWLEAMAGSQAALRGPGERYARERADRLTRRYLAARGQHFRVLFGQTLGTMGVQLLAAVALLAVGGFLVVSGQLTLGQLVAAELIVSAVTASLSKVGKLLDSTYDLLTSVTKLGKVLALPIEPPERAAPLPGEGPVSVELDQASDGAHPPVTARIARGERVALVAGPRPLADWLAGLRSPEAGAVLIDGAETTFARSPTWRDSLAVVRGADLFEGSVLDNVSLGRDGVRVEDVRDALARTAVLASVRALPGGLEAPLDGHGGPLDDAQRAQLAVARALACRPRLVVLDDTLETLPAPARQACLSALTDPAAPWTLVALVSDPGGPVAQACARVVQLDAAKEVA